MNVGKRITQKRKEQFRLIILKLCSLNSTEGFFLPNENEFKRE